MAETMALAVVPVLFGALVSLLALPFRRWARQRRSRRLLVALGCALLTAVLAFLLFTYFGAYLAYELGAFYAPSTGQTPDDPSRSTQIVGGELAEALDRNRRAIMLQLWVRQMVPSAVRRPCYTRDAAICDLLEWFTPYELQGDLGLIAASVAPSLVSGAIAWLLTRPRTPAAQGVP